MNEVVAFAVPNPVAVLTDAKTYSEFYKSIKEQIAVFEPDTSTESGRKKIASMAYKVTRSKTAIDDAGKKLNEEARAQINAVDATRRKIREELETLATEVRKPLTEWETREETRKVQAVADLKQIADLSVVLATDSAENIKARIAELAAIEISEDVHIDGTDHARTNQADAIAKLQEALARVEKYEADQRELARLRQEAEERERQEQDRREKARLAEIEAEKAAKARAEYEENVRRQAEAAEKSKKDAAERERLAVEEARQSEIIKARAEQDRVEREAQAAVAKAEAEARAVKEKADREERERQEADAKTKREQAAREADRAYRGRIMGEAKEAMIAIGTKEAVAKALVLAIVAGEIPHVTLRF